FLLLGNPGDGAVTATISLLVPAGTEKQVTMTVPAHSRATLKVDDVVPADSVAAEVVAGAPVVAERATYFRHGDVQDGTASEGVTAPAPHWYLPEGYTGPGFETWLLVENPLTTSVPAAIRLLPGHSGPVELSLTVPADSRRTIGTRQVLPAYAKTFGIQVVSDRPLGAERAIYLPQGATDAPGAPAPATGWYFAEGYIGGGFGTTFALANPGPKAATVTVRLGAPGGALSTTALVTVPGRGRATLDVRTLGLAFAEFSTEVTATVPVV